ncbi:ABC transporter substrate binding protein [Maridesulfovibrio sp.]|uniref:ABC transporter substrate-binding protein n=1 Tax=Maridesulfovibrio sp. TaxID=2795000 RepID=UPI002A188EDF|nr:ABC transporter substrate binding protein [Maridesulfovibrio sp.]
MKIVRFLFLLLSLLSALSSSAFAGLPRIMIVNSYHADFLWVKDHNSILKRGLEGKADLSFHDLDYKRRYPDNCADNIARVKAFSEHYKPDLVVLTDDFAVRELGGYFESKGIPIIFLGVNGNIRNYVSDTRHMTGVFERPLMKRSIFYLRELVGPSLKRALVIMDDGLSAKALMEESFNNESSFNVSDTHVDVELLPSFSKWKKSVLSAKKRGYNALVVGTYHIFKDSHGRIIESKEVMHWTAENSPLPVFALWALSVGKGRAIGGYVVCGLDQGREALKLIERVLNGEKVEDIQPVMNKQGHLLFSAPELKRWNIDPFKGFGDKGYQIRIMR